MFTAHIRHAFCLLVIALGALAGCARSPSSSAECWLKAHGGVLADARLQRAEEALASLSLVHVHAGRTLKVAVVDSQHVGAFSWPSGEIVITRSLIDVLDDDELAAAIAHEAGHLLADGHLTRPVALNGCASDADAETTADLLARELLQIARLPQDALPRLLRKVADHPDTTEVCRNHLNRRIARLRFQF